MTLADSSTAPMRVACFATQGSASGDERRIASLLAPLAPEVIPVSRGRRRGGIWDLIRRLRRARPDLIVMEGTGTTGGLAVLALRLLAGTPYVVSSGDAVAPFLWAMSTPLGLAGAVYEWLLYRCSSGFIGWSPYLVGRALTYGAPRAMTAPNWAEQPPAPRGQQIRARLGIPADALVFGIVGSLNWSDRYGYCYGLELVRAALATQRHDLRILVVGDGEGRARLAELAGDRLNDTILLPGAVAREEVADFLDAMDVVSLPQSVDGVGAFRYTTKISEYLAAGRPVVTGEIPLAYDLDEGWLWRLPGDAPWDPLYLDSLSSLMASLTREEALERRPQRNAAAPLFDRDRQVRQASAFILDVVARERRRAGA